MSVRFVVECRLLLLEKECYQVCERGNEDFFGSDAT